MFVIRKRLSASEGAPAGTRVNPDTLEIETSPDGGTTWNPDPGADPRTNDAYRLPASTEGDCAAAAGMVSRMQEFVQKVFLAGGLITGANAGIFLITVMLPGAGWLFSVALAIASAVVGSAGVIIAASFTTLVWEQIQCILYCNMDEDGQISSAQLVTILSEIYDQCGETVHFGVNLMVQAWGAVGLSNAGVLYADPEADCSGCECAWCNEWQPANFSDWAAVNFAGFTNQPTGILDGSGWNSRDISVSPGGDGNCHYDTVVIRLTMPVTTTVTQVEILFDIVLGAFNGSCEAGQSLVTITLLNGATQVGINTGSGYTTGTNRTGVWSGSVTANIVEVRVTASFYRPVVGGPPGSALIKMVRVRGDGDDPYEYENCSA